MQRVLSHLRRAADDYSMINEGDKIAVGVSGGKDSVTLALGLHALSRFYPKKFEVVPITLDMGYDETDFSPLVSCFEKAGMNLITEKTNIKTILFDIRKEKNPCSLCAKLRRGALHNTAKKYGCNKVALGHHFDDVIETFFLCLFYEGRLGCFSPVTYLDRQDIHVIRPLIYMTENDIKSFIRRSGSPVIHNPCPADGFTKRQYIKELLASLAKENPGIPERIFHAVLSLPDWKRE